MWNLLVLVVMTTLASLYMGADQKNAVAAEQVKAENLAGSMAVYREAVINYFSQHPALVGTSVDLATLKINNALPAWSILYTQPATSTWANYRDNDGMIYVYASAPAPYGVVADVLTLSQNSVLAGVYRSGDVTLYSPVFGDTGVKLPPSSAVAIPNGSPVWIAMIR